ncbi:MAG: response regulator [Deltaproteobacteria bacterium]|nr:response regulator [Deltaproteobacteria bacterium]
MTHKILVVDDEENMQVLLKRVLGKAGCDVKCAGSGQAALRLTKNNHFDLAVIDVCMPEMNGIELLTKLKGINSQIPVIMISAYPSWGKKETAERLGCADYLSKPVDMKYLKELIKKELEE